MRRARATSSDLASPVGLVDRDTDVGEEDPDIHPPFKGESAVRLSVHAKVSESKQSYKSDYYQIDRDHVVQ